MAVSHHYRICEETAYDCWKFPSKTDRVAHRWAKSLFNEVQKACYLIFGQDKGCPDALPHESLHEAYLRLGEDKRSAELRAKEQEAVPKNPFFGKKCTSSGKGV